MARLLEDIMEDILEAIRDANTRDYALQLNSDGPVFLAYGADIVDVRIADPFDGSAWSTGFADSDSTIASYVTHVDTTGGPVSLVIPAGLASSARQPIVLTHVAGDASVSPITITDGGSATFNGQSSIILDTSFASVTLVARGGNWYVASLYGG